MMNMYIDVFAIFIRCRRHNNRVISSVIESIERFNRPLIWRLVEYTVFFFQSLFNRVVITNYSIGRYQIKVSYILDYYNIEYKLAGKVIHLGAKLRIRTIISIIFASKKEEVLINLISLKFPYYALDSLSSEELREILMFYSRSIEFDDGVNYYTFGKRLYSVGVNYYIA